MQTIKYISFYDNSSNFSEGGSYSPAATTKIDYICQVLNRSGFAVSLISLCKSGKKKVRPGKLITLSEHNTLRYFFSLGRGSKIRNGIDFVLGNLLLFFYLVLHVNKNELILVYHSLGYRNVINLAKKVRGFKVVLEVEEIYQDAANIPARLRSLEYKLICHADGYIFPSILLDEKINTKSLPAILIHGSYGWFEPGEQGFGDKCIHVVYAGTFDQRKGGALAAIKAAAYLPPSYRVHILGFGSDHDIKSVLSAISEINLLSKAQVTYDGMLTGQDFDDFICKCHIGLSTQNPELEFNDTSFPSKILAYMGHGLQVVSGRIGVVERSSLSQYVKFYDRNDSKYIADAIMDVEVFNQLHVVDVIKELDRDLVKKMPGFINSFI